MKPGTEKLLIAGILVTGVVAFWAHSAGASSSVDSGVPASFYPTLTPFERQYVYSEVQNSTGQQMLTRSSVYASTVLGDGSHLSPLALAALAAEAAKKGAA
jgi:hypothetical protein